MNNLISVVVPVYNVEKYLKQCIDSVLAQTYSNFELILVNDGSSDNCLTICREYEASDNRVSVIDQPNRGASAARNNGIANAKGAYIVFIDSDDHIHKDYLSVLQEAAARTGADVCICGYEMFYDGIDTAPSKIAYPHPVGDNFNGIDILKAISGDNTYCVVVWNKLYKKEIFDTICFPEGGTWCEDNYIFHHIFFKCNKVVCLADKLYYYRQRPGSSMHSEFSAKRLENSVESWIDRIDFYEKHGLRQLMAEPYGGYVQAITRSRKFMDFTNTVDLRAWKEKKREFNGHCLRIFRCGNLYAIIKFYFAMLFPLTFARLRLALDNRRAAQAAPRP